MLMNSGRTEPCYSCSETAWCDPMNCPDCKLEHPVCEKCLLDGLRWERVSINASNTLYLLVCLRPSGIGRTLEGA